jgi:uncharacterized membrane protein HdeD (DUF308 family)
VDSKIWQALLFGIVTILAGISTIYSQGLYTGILAMKVSFQQALLVGILFILFGLWVCYNAYKFYKNSKK